MTPDCISADLDSGSSTPFTNGQPASPGSASSNSGVSRLRAPKDKRHGTGQSISVSTHAAPPNEYMSSGSTGFNNPTLPSKLSHVFTTKNGGSEKAANDPHSTTTRQRPEAAARKTATNQPMAIAKNETSVASPKLLSSSPQLI